MAIGIPFACGRCGKPCCRELRTHLCKARHLIKCCLSKLKQFCRVATLAAIVLWLR